MAKKIGIVTSSLTTGHSIRGIGFYTRNLLLELTRIAPKYDLKIYELGDNSSSISVSEMDLIHYPYFDIFNHSLPIHKSKKCIVTIHDLTPLEYPQIYKTGYLAKINFFLQKISLGGVSYVITDSYASVKVIKKHLDIPNEKIKLIPLAAGNNFQKISNVNMLKHVRQKYNLPDKFVLYVGDINYIKNLNMLIKACNSKSIPLCIAGKNITELDKLDTSHPELIHIRETKELIRSENTKLLGFVPDEDIAAVYNLATMYCQPSLMEGFGLTPLEAMACGTPIIISNADALRELVSDGMQEFIFVSTQITDLENKLEILWTDAKVRKRNSVLGLKKSSDFSWEKTAEQTIQTYLEAL